MAFSRVTSPKGAVVAEALTRDMAGIGLILGGRANHDANIEDTLLRASEEGTVRGDLRVLAVLTTWLGLHGARVNVDRIRKLVEAGGSPRTRAYWAAVGRWLAKDRRYARLVKLHRGDPVDLLGVGTTFQVRRHGEDPRFAGSALRVPGNVLRDRPADVLTPGELARRHRAYAWRIAIGSTYRADMWAALEAEPNLRPAELARRTYGSFATAWQARADRQILAPTIGARESASGSGIRLHA